MTYQRKIAVIGGGLGGISAAVSLKQKGFDVTVYEKNSHIGGKLNRHEQDGFGFDLGPSLLTMPDIFRRLFEASHVDMTDYVEIEEIELQWRAFFGEKNKVIDWYGDINHIKSANPFLQHTDIKDIESFLKYSKKLNDVTKSGYFDAGLDNLKEIIHFHGPLSALKDFDYFHTMQSAINKRINDRDLRDMLGYFIKYVGSSAYDAPAILNMLPYMQYEQGAWYVKGGLHHLSAGIVRLAEEIGVNICTGIEVKTVITDDSDRIKNIVLNDGSVIPVDYVVSNMEVIPFYKKVLDRPVKNLPELEKKYPPASSGLVLHVGVKGHYRQLKHHNFFFSNDSKKNYKTVFKDNQLPEDPTIYLVNTNKTDTSQAPEGFENLKILPHIPNLKNTNFTKADYLEFRERVLIKLENMGLKDLRKNIVTEYLLTPHDIEQMYHSNHGAIYGTLSDRKVNKGFKHPKHSEEINNLYFVGGTVNPGGGMPMVTLSGQQVAKMIAEAESLK